MQDPSFAVVEHRLKDGQSARLRPIRPDDADRLIDLFGRLTPESVYFRFLETRPSLPRPQAEAFARVDYASSMAIVATAPRPEGEAIIGVARYAAIGAPQDAVAEAAIVVEDAFQSQGLGTVLLTALADYAADHGIRAFQATVHANNQRILSFIEGSGLPTHKRLEAGVWDIRVDLPEHPGS